MSENGESALGAIEQQTTEAVGENRRNLTETLSKIERDEDLSESAKARYREQAIREASERHVEIVAEYERQGAEALEEAEANVFRLAYPAQLTASDKERFPKPPIATLRSARSTCQRTPSGG